MTAVPIGFRALPLEIEQLSLAAVLKCGQSFRWSIFPLLQTSDAASPSHEYRLALEDRVISLRQSPTTLFHHTQLPQGILATAAHESETQRWLKDYFQLDVDLLNLYDQWSEMDPVFKSFRSRFSGIRMLRQDPFENLISFICSSNNNISRISKMVTGLCKHFSPALLSMLPPDDPAGPAETYHPFPPIRLLADPSVSSVLRTLGFGYRAEFIQRTAKILMDEHQAPKAFLLSLRGMPTEEARTELVKFVGVGRKVADCVLLMSMDKREVVPVDTHVHQIAIKHYGLRGKTGGAKVNMTPKLYKEVNEKLSKVWGPYAGWAHSVLFTADLKSFSSYGLPSPAPATPLVGTTPRRKSKLEEVDTESDTLPVLLPLSPAPSPQKKRKLEDPDLSLKMEEPTGVSLADRVKKRRRGASVTYTPYG